MTNRDKPAKSHEPLEHIVADRDAKSRTVEIKDGVKQIPADVEVNERPDMMGDEGPVARSNPHNKA